jgi:hypothetical protein
VLFENEYEFHIESVSKAPLFGSIAACSIEHARDGSGHGFWLNK